MISSLVIKAFHERVRRDYRAWKKLPVAELDRRASLLRVRPPIWNGLRKEQKVCLLIGIREKRFLYLLDTGVGKSALAIALVRWFRRAGLIKRALVLVPNKVNVGEWEDEIKKHTPGTPYALLVGSSEEKWAQLESSSDKTAFAVTTYDGLARMVTTSVEIALSKLDKREIQILKLLDRKTPRPATELAASGKDMQKLCRLKLAGRYRPVDAAGKPLPMPKSMYLRTTGKQHLTLSPKLLRRLAKQVDGLIDDESTEVANKAALPFRICRQLAKTCGCVFALTGTPFGKDPLPIWAQMFLVDGGESLGETLGLFRAAFYGEHVDNFGRTHYTFKRNERKRLHNYLAHRSIRYPLDQSSLPKAIEVPLYYRLADDPQSYYDKARDMLRSARGDFATVKRSFLRMRQISSGFLGYYDDEAGEKAQIEFTPNVKLEGLVSLVRKIDPARKGIIFHDFIYSGHMISRELTKLGIKHSRLYGGTKDAIGELQAFKHDESIPWFVVNNAAGAYGLNLQQVANYAAWYEIPVPLIQRIQTRRRIERPGSAFDKVFLYDLLVRGTVDESIVDSHKSGRDLLKDVMDGVIAL